MLIGLFGSDVTMPDECRYTSVAILHALHTVRAGKVRDCFPLAEQVTVTFPLLSIMHF
jgi:hypothetical protein